MNIITRTFRFLAWELRRRRQEQKLPPAIRAQLRRIEEKPFSAPCPICGEEFEHGSAFRWHLVGHD
jgi:hypothetical protein